MDPSRGDAAFAAMVNNLDDYVGDVRNWRYWVLRRIR